MGCIQNFGGNLAGIVVAILTGRFLVALLTGSVVTLLEAAAFCFITERLEEKGLKNITIVHRILTILLSVITIEIVLSAYAEK
jgi:hypothetical protein